MGGKKLRDSNRYTPVRFSHLTAYAGVGSIVRDNNDFLMAVTDIRYWKSQGGVQTGTQIRFIERVKKHLNITKSLYMPPVAQINVAGGAEVVGYPIPAVIFPSYAKCKSCNRLHHKPWYGVGNDISKNLRCENCKEPGLEQVTWCAVSSAGDLRDVPWHYICHKDSSAKCEHDYSAVYLEIFTGNKGQKRVRCTRCDSSNRFEQVDTKFQGDFQPWVKEAGNASEPKTYTVMEVNDPRVYSSKKERAIVIPPESNVDKNSIAYKLSCNSVLMNNIEGESRPHKKKKMLITAANDYRCTVQDIRDALEIIELEKSDLNTISASEMLVDEFNALMTIEDFKEGADFITTHKTQEWKSYLMEVALSGELARISNVVGDVVSVDRLRVIEAFMGFYRTASDFVATEDEFNVVPPDINGGLDWLPAIELFGEGIFFTINESILENWEGIQELRLRAAEVSKRYEKLTVGTFKNLPVVSPRFMLLHTLSHLIIRELEVSAGYPAASLRERIYCSQSEGMAGILIYTAVPDIAGSLGGITEAAEPKNFIKLLDGVFKHAQWCSLDPVCTEHQGQGPGLLNRAACHACALIPETSCDYGNVFLDRVFLKGSRRSNIPSLLDFCGENSG